MMYAQIIDNSIRALGRLPRSARRLDTGQWVMGLATASTDLQRACGWWEVVDTDPPTVTATQVAEQTVDLVAGVPTRVWSVRDKTTDELAADAEDANRVTIETVARSALASNRADITQAQNIAAQADTLLSATLSNNGQRDNAIRNLAAGVKLLAQQSEAQARQLSALIRLTVRDFSAAE
jgi:hypothetical protein